MPGRFRMEIATFLAGHAGAMCSQCIATTLALPLREVTITTLGLNDHGGFVMKLDAPCSKCSVRGRVIEFVAEGPRQGT